MFRATLGAAILGAVLADCVHAVRTGGLPVYQLPVPWGIALGVLLAMLALRPALPAARAACLLGLGLVFLATALPSSYVTHHKIQTTAITLLFAIGGALVAVDEGRPLRTVMVIAALVAALLRGLWLGS